MAQALLALVEATSRTRYGEGMMTMEQFAAEKARLVTLYGDTGRNASGKRAQALARLYAQSGWTQEALAEVEGMSQQRITQLLVFGRFLFTTVCSKAVDCSEGQFRAIWARTDKAASDEARFAAVEAMFEEESMQQRTAPGTTRTLAKEIIAQFSDGKVHRLRDIAEAVGGDIDVVRSLCDRIVTKGTFQTFGERRSAPPAQGSYAYRFVKGGKKKLDVTAFYTEVQPFLDDLDTLANGHHVDFSQEAVKLASAQIRKVIERMVR
jgi:hypothetical protein